MNKILGIVLIVGGIIALAWGGFSYTTREKVVDIGPIHASRDKHHSVPLSPRRRHRASGGYCARGRGQE